MSLYILAVTDPSLWLRLLQNYNTLSRAPLSSFAFGSSSTLLNLLSTALRLTPAWSITLFASDSFFCTLSSAVPNFPNSDFISESNDQTSLDRFQAKNAGILIYVSEVDD